MTGGLVRGQRPAQRATAGSVARASAAPGRVAVAEVVRRGEQSRPRIGPGQDVEPADPGCRRGAGHEAGDLDRGAERDRRHVRSGAAIVGEHARTGAHVHGFRHAQAQVDPGQAEQRRYVDTGRRQHRQRQEVERDAGRRRVRRGPRLPSRGQRRSPAVVGYLGRRHSGSAPRARMQEIDGAEHDQERDHGGQDGARAPCRRCPAWDCGLVLACISVLRGGCGGDAHRVPAVGPGHGVAAAGAHVGAGQLQARQSGAAGRR